MNGTTIAGGCLCGQVRFRTDRAPLMARACWCRDCQYLSSGNASINLIVPSDGLEITGRTQEFVSVADSGNVMRRRFCPSCGTQLFSESVDHPERLVVRAGALDDQEGVLVVAGTIENLFAGLVGAPAHKLLYGFHLGTRKL